MTSQTIYLTGDEPLVREIVTAAFPAYKGRKIKIRTCETLNVASYWSEGSRSYFAFVRLSGAHCLGIVPDQSAYDPQIPGSERVVLSPEVACVEHEIFAGKDRGITIHVHPSALNPSLLAAPTALDDDERKVLIATRSYKPSYNGDPEYRRHQTRLSREAWDAAKARLQARGLLNKAGAITVAGRNAVGTANL
jgi:hypothetical protein